MGSFRVLSHTADVGFKAKGASIPDLYETAARAMFSFEYDLSTVGYEREVPVTAEADDLEGGLYAWLSELLFLHDSEGFVPGDVVVVELGPTGRPGGRKLRVRGSARGRMMGDWFEQTGPQIKAVTMHGLEVKPVRAGFEATVYLDV